MLLAFVIIGFVIIADWIFWCIEVSMNSSSSLYMAEFLVKLVISLLFVAFAVRLLRRDGR